MRSFITGSPSSRNNISRDCNVQLAACEVIREVLIPDLRVAVHGGRLEVCCYEGKIRPFPIRGDEKIAAVAVSLNCSVNIGHVRGCEVFHALARCAVVLRILEAQPVGNLRSCAVSGFKMPDVKCVRCLVNNTRLIPGFSRSRSLSDSQLTTYLR